jgi:hypothetical protein
MQPDAPQFTVRKCKRVKIEWYVDGPWENVPEQERAAFMYKPFPEQFAREIAQRENEIMSGMTSILHEFWISKLPEEIRKIVDKPYRMV